jgi:CubicO group peptidase (beta-lactamase class C family)
VTGTAEGAIEGFVAPGFEPVAAAFAANFSEGGEVGAAFAVHRDDGIIVDLWGGLADSGDSRGWSRDTLQLIFSGTKGLVAMCILMLIDRGELDLDAPVYRYWPEFAAGGKEVVTVREAVSHAARIPGVSTPLTPEAVADDRRMAIELASQPLFTDPRARHAYHALTYGWLCGELVRRIDGRSVGRFFADEIATPLGLEVFIGLPAALEPRVSRLQLASNWGVAPAFDASAVERDELMKAVWGNPPLFGPEPLHWNSPTYHQAEIPAANGIGTARDIATLYGSLDKLLSPEVILLGRTVLEERHDPLLDEPQAFGVGFELQTGNRMFGPPADAFGHTGAGGSTHGAWPEQHIGFSYAMNLMRDDQPTGDERPRRLLEALYGCLTRSQL